MNPNASYKQLTVVSRIATIIMALLSAFVATFINNLGAMWELYGAMVAGLGLPHVLRWVWWRANAWTEISGMVTALVLAIVNYLATQNGALPADQMSIFPSSLATHPIHVICLIALASCLASIIGTYATKPVDDKTLQKFAEKVRPIGFWREFWTGTMDERSLGRSIFLWLLGTASIYAGLFGIGFWIRQEKLTGSILLAFFVVSLWVMVKGLAKVEGVRLQTNGTDERLI